MRKFLILAFTSLASALSSGLLTYWILTGQFSTVLASKLPLTVFIVVVSAILTGQGVFTLAWMLYAWEDPENVRHHRSPKRFRKQKLSFTALIPAKHEEKVIQDTIRAVDKIKYPEALKETLVLCREDDMGTISKAEEVINELGKENIKLVIFNSFPINKPHALNQGLKEARNAVVAVFDAEDEPHSDIYNVVNTVMLRDEVDVVQSGVQLMNYRSHWFSTINVMEYFFWFKSGLHFFSKIGKVTPLGGNTIFFKRDWLGFIGGWDENCLTEDADIGVRLALAGAQMRIVYDEKHATQEETPASVECFIRQRTRWNQGFLQIFLKGEWKKFPLIRQKIVVSYILLSPILHALLLLYIPFGIYIAFIEKLPLIVSLFSFVPFYLFFLQILVFTTGLYEFTKAYNFRFPLWMPLEVFAVFYPYQLLLMLSSFRAVYRVALSRNGWEKTYHKNAHRKMPPFSIAGQYA